MIGAAMTGARWTYALTRVPNRVFHRLNTWAWWALDDSGKPMPKKARRAAGAATLILAVAAVGASAMQWVEPQRAAILWGWFSILAIAGSALQASRQNRPKKPEGAASGEPAPTRPFKQRLRAFPREALAASGVAARGACASIRRSAPGHAGKVWSAAWQTLKIAGKKLAIVENRVSREIISNVRKSTG